MAEEWITSLYLKWMSTWCPCGGWLGPGLALPTAESWLRTEEDAPPLYKAGVSHAVVLGCSRHDMLCRHIVAKSLTFGFSAPEYHVGTDFWKSTPPCYIRGYLDSKECKWKRKFPLFSLCSYMQAAQIDESWDGVISRERVLTPVALFGDHIQSVQGYLRKKQSHRPDGRKSW